MDTIAALCILISAIFVLPYILITVIFSPIMWLGSILSTPFDWVMTKASNIFARKKKVKNKPINAF